jgi:mannose/fructose/N-acetylgalactosamine-specific phosphotransferase system component IID
LTNKKTCVIINSQRTKEVKKMDSILGWFVITVLANCGLIKMAVVIYNDRENQKKENERYWEEHGWGN